MLYSEDNHQIKDSTTATFLDLKVIYLFLFCFITFSFISELGIHNLVFYKAEFDHSAGVYMCYRITGTHQIGNFLRISIA